MSIKEPPQFNSNIPEHLLANVNPEMKWIMENMSVLTQKSDYLVTTQGEQSAKLDILDGKATVTNGKIAQAILDINTINEERAAQKQDLSDIIGIKRFGEKYLFNKWGAVVLVIFIFGSIKVIETPAIRELLVNFLS